MRILYTSLIAVRVYVANNFTIIVQKTVLVIQTISHILQVHAFFHSMTHTMTQLYVVRRTGFGNFGIHFVNSQSSIFKSNVIHLTQFILADDHGLWFRTQQ